MDGTPLERSATIFVYGGNVGKGAMRVNQRAKGKPPVRTTATQRAPNARPPPRPQSHGNPYRLYGFLFGGLAVLLAALIWWLTARFDLLLSWLIAITAVTFAAYGYDKSIAGSDKVRVPERVLLGLTFAGGTIGALIGMRVFHHKTIKESFRRKFWAVVVLQIVIVLVYAWLR
jgi:uncharacterized membrane protein YsdA (DUF1294 family)